ncbi:uncharacterized protein LOC134189727 [Corticium candelabrum]|uniref:uncharacterized protein LOC134189727 n=1 Tax=Corticium candelabrum TaxID=121492 RepID=UPI002E26F305|nr:uncharacterized protein LOC134189727 [Corticium candelabrum]
MWVRPIFQQRRQQGDFHQLLQELRRNDPESHFRFLRMSKETFDCLVEKGTPSLTTRSYQSGTRAEISPAERLAMTLRYLATGSSQVSFSFNFRVGRSTVCRIIRDTCTVLWEVLQPHYVKAPSNEEEWKGIATDFEKIWNSPNCIGAIDGKHVLIQAPAGAGSVYYNYKETHSIVLMAVCDAHYRFLIVDVGDSGRHSDGGVLAQSAFGQALESGTLSLPSSRELPGTATRAPYVFVGDEAFPLRTHMLRPYPGRNLPDAKAVFNYRLS